MTTNNDALRDALMLCEWIAETPHQRGSINGKAAHVAHLIHEAIAASKPEPDDLSELGLHPAIESAVRDASKPEAQEHRPGCEALGGYGNGVGPCTCKPEPQAQRSVTPQEDAVLRRAAMRSAKVIHPMTTQHTEPHDFKEWFGGGLSASPNCRSCGRLRSDPVHKPEPQAQAAEPEVVAVVDDRLVNRCNWKLDAKCKDGEELITLQSHREVTAKLRAEFAYAGMQASEMVVERDRAITKKDAALKALAEQSATAEKQALEVINRLHGEAAEMRAALKGCLEALEMTIKYQDAISIDGCAEISIEQKTKVSADWYKVRAAITKAQEAMK